MRFITMGTFVFQNILDRVFRLVNDFQHRDWDGLVDHIGSTYPEGEYRTYIEHRIATELYDYFYQKKKTNKILDNEWLPSFIDRYRMKLGYTPICFISPLLLSRDLKLTTDKYVTKLMIQARRPHIELYRKITNEAIISLAFRASQDKNH